MAKYRIPVSWTMSADVEVEANTLEEAYEVAKDGDLPEHGEYVESSFEVDIAIVEENLDGFYGEITEGENEQNAMEQS